MKLRVPLHPPTRIQIVHEAPKVAYEAPKVAYEAPKVAYEAPKVAYEAPKVAYEAPRVAPTYGGYETVKAAPAHGAELKESHRMIPIVKHVREDDTRGHFKLELAIDPLFRLGLALPGQAFFSIG